MYRSRCRSLRASKNCCAACRVRACKSPQKLSCNSSTKCWKCSLITVIFAMGVSLLFWNGFSLRGQSQLTPSCFLHNRIYITLDLWAARPCGWNHKGLLHGRNIGASQPGLGLMQFVGLIGLVVGLHQKFHGERIVPVFFKIADGLF